MPNKKIKNNIKPSNKTDVATIDLNNIDQKLLQEYVQRIVGLSREELKINLNVTEDEEITPEARKRIKNSILSTST